MANDNVESNFLEDLYESARELVTDRFSSPFIFSFIVSWLVLNYQAVIVIFTEVSEKFSINTKLDLIHQYLVNSSISVPSLENSILLKAFIWPLIAACFYTFIYPFADYYITKFTLNRKVNIRNVRTRAEEKIIYSQKDVQKIYQQHLRVENDLTAQLKRAEITENQLRLLVNDLETKNKLFVDVEKQKAELEIKFKNISDQYQKDLKNQKKDKVTPATLAKEGLTITPNKMLLKEREEDETRSIINDLTKTQLAAIMKLGTLQKGKDVGIDDVTTDIETFHLEELERDEIFTKGTNPKSLNKRYKLSYMGKMIYDYLLNENSKT